MIESSRTNPTADRRTAFFPTWQGMIIIFAVLLVVPLSLVARGDSVLRGDVRFERFLQRTPEPVGPWLADFGNRMGSTAICILLATLLIGGLLIARRPGPALFLLAVNTARAINALLKSIYDSPRPTADLVHLQGVSDGLGFPSGHSNGAMLFYGGVAIVAVELVPIRVIRVGVQAICVAIIVMVGFGRIYSGAHWPSDVLGGYLYGLIVLMCLHTIAVRIRRARRDRADT